MYSSLAETQASAGMLRYIAQICLQIITFFLICKLFRALKSKASYIPLWPLKKIYILFFEILIGLLSLQYIKIISKYKKYVSQYLSFMEFRFPAFRSFCKTDVHIFKIF